MNLNFKSLTWPQVVFLLGLLAAPILAFHFAGPLAAQITTLVSTIVAWFTNSQPPSPPSDGAGSPALKLITGGVAALALLVGVNSCGIFAEYTPTIQDGADIGNHAGKLDDCEEQVLDAKKLCEMQGRPDCAAEAWSVWTACKSDAGIGGAK